MRKKQTQKPVVRNDTSLKKKRAAKKKIVKPRVARTRNHGTWTEAMFWQQIRAALRNKSRWWKPVLHCKLAARRPYKGPYKRLKFEYQCNLCKDWFPETQIDVDHISPAGSLNCYADLAGFVERLFCEIDGLQCLCKKCHSDIKTKQDKEDMKTIREQKAA